MKRNPKWLIVCYVVLCTVILMTALCLTYYNSSLAENYTLVKGDSLRLNTLLPVTAEYTDAQYEEPVIGQQYGMRLKLLGLFPVKHTQVQIVDDTKVAVLGTPFGIRLYTDGVLVVELSNVPTESGSVSPAKRAGIRVGDYVCSVNGQTVDTNDDLAEIIEDSGGSRLTFVVRRGQQEMAFDVLPVLSSEDHLYKAGIWIRDSSAGIGTLTFYAPSVGVVCGLGHGIYDSDTGSVMAFRTGRLVGADIITVQKGAPGQPGELKGRLNYGNIGAMLANDSTGVYGKMECNGETESLTPLAFAREVQNGPAQLLVTLDKNGPQFFSCDIRVKETKVNDTVQNMTVTITDPSLIAQTGGIVQGMSGSPLIQNGKLIGAITHVLVDDPTTGYAIFAENMLETAQGVASENKVKEAS